jgi:tetratricopeptide (TPR) repeat protein
MNTTHSRGGTGSLVGGFAGLTQSLGGAAPLRIALAALALVPAIVEAGNPDASEAEAALLPKWCAFAIESRSVHGEGAWKKIPDPVIRFRIHALDERGCNGYHHYCYGIVWTNRWQQNPTASNNQWGGMAIGDYEYVLRQSNPDTCPLVVDMRTKIGEIYLLQGDAKRAEESYRKALKIKPSYAPAYIGLSDLFENQGATDKSLAILQAGIKANPKSTALKKKLDRVQQRVSGTATQPREDVPQ